jgi:hypothetical protein
MHVPWRDLAAGDLIALQREPWRVLEVRAVPVADWEDCDQRYYEKAQKWPLLRDNPQRGPEPLTRETWPARPLYLILVPVTGGKKRHQRVRPYAGASAYVFPEHYPVCKDCGELYPCRELDIRAEADREMKVLDKWEAILPGSCWGCNEPITHRQSAIRFEGENLYLPGAPPPVFHMRRSGGCQSAARDYEDRWVKAAEGRQRRLSCMGRLIIHVDGPECTEDPFCPGPGKMHRASYQNHTAYEGNVRCLRCADARARGETPAVPEPPAHGGGMLRLDDGE